MLKDSGFTQETSQRSGSTWVRCEQSIHSFYTVEIARNVNLRFSLFDRRIIGLKEQKILQRTSIENLLKDLGFTQGTFNRYGSIWDKLDQSIHYKLTPVYVRLANHKLKAIWLTKRNRYPNGKTPLSILSQRGLGGDRHSLDQSSLNRERASTSICLPSSKQPNSFSILSLTLTQCPTLTLVHLRNSDCDPHLNLTKFH